MKISPRIYRIGLESVMVFAAAAAWKMMPGPAGVAALVLFLVCLAGYVYLQRYATRPSPWDAVLAPLSDTPEVHTAFRRAARRKHRVSDRALVAAAVRRCGACLELADEALQDDKALVLAAIGNTPHALRHASGRLRADREVVLEAVKRAGALVKDVSDELKDDDEVGSAALRSDPESLRFLSDRLRSDKAFVVSGVANLYPRLQQLGALPLADAAFFLAFYTDRVPHKLALGDFFPGVDAAEINRAEAQAGAFMLAVPGIASDYVANRNAATHQNTLSKLKTRFAGYGDEVYHQAVSAQISANR